MGKLLSVRFSYHESLHFLSVDLLIYFFCVSEFKEAVGRGKTYEGDKEAKPQTLQIIFNFNNGLLIFIMVHTQ